MKTAILMTLLIFTPALHPSYATAANTRANAVSGTAKPILYQKEDDKYPGYSMDGVTSASKLAAQRSHTVAGKDERNFAVFTGITVILMVVFFAQIIMGKK